MTRCVLAVAVSLLLAACTARPPAPSSHEPVPPPVGVGASLRAPAEIGRTVDQRPILAETLGRGSRRVYIIGLIHGNEPEGLPTLDTVRTVLGAQGRAVARLVPNMNPDGLLAGSRGNARGVDLNRNWPASNFSPHRTRGTAPLSEPETRAVHDDLVRFRPDVLVVLHSIRRGGPFVNFDGPPPAADLAAAFAEGASQTGDPRWRVVADMGYPTPGSLGTFAGLDTGIPTLTIEFARGHDPERARRAVEAGLAAVLGAMGRHPIARGSEGDAARSARPTLSLGGSLYATHPHPDRPVFVAADPPAARMHRPGHPRSDRDLEREAVPDR